MAKQALAPIERQVTPTEQNGIQNAGGDVLITIRDAVRRLPRARHDEIFADFESAVKSRNLGYLADTIANWAAGGHGYEDRGIVVNADIIESLPDLQSNPQLSAAWHEYMREQDDPTNDPDKS